ncbi:hypothetical protein MAA8898_02487 [Maliponia aquimaris]|uniref:Secreted protein n=2 Tax=Maliponia aquimaris TaxID=1673631 RepID=A0A238KH55_9RHOB|nr:hypothetical protein MAA8898_02487 [Maliponia aquimaris]
MCAKSLWTSAEHAPRAARFGGVFRSLGALALLSMLTALPAAAQDSDDPVARAVATCQQDDTLDRCPNYCQVACTSTGFLLDHTDACDVAMAALPDADEASCPVASDEGIVTLQACIDEKRSIPREPGRVIERNPERLRLFNDFFSDRPDCAASTIALEAMFGCLSGETSVVQRDYEALGTLGVGAAPLTADRLRELACAIDEDRLIEIDIGASSLSGRATELSDNLGEVSSCRRAYAQWLDDRADTFCASSDFPNCEAVISLFQSELQNSLDGAEEQNRQISDVVDNLERDLGAILSLALVPVSACQ